MDRSPRLTPAADEHRKIDVSRALAFVRAAKSIPEWFSTTAIDKRWTLGRLAIRFHMRRSDGLMGRFGGGWNWKFGVQVGGSTTIVSLLIADMTIELLPKVAA